MTDYIGPLYRPPAERRAFLLPITIGCSYNRCAFCVMYAHKTFRIREAEAIQQDIDAQIARKPRTWRVFLADGDAFVLSTKRLEGVLDRLATAFPRLKQVSAYADAKSVLTKSDQELRCLREKRLSSLYFGLESGSDEVLALQTKDATAAEYSAAIQKAQAAGFTTNAIVLLGAGGSRLSTHHAHETARIASECAPDYLAALTLTVIPESPLATMIRTGEFEPISPRQSLEELRILLTELKPARDVLLQVNHGSNYVPMTGVIPAQREALLRQLEDAMTRGRMKEEWQRSL